MHSCISSVCLFGLPKENKHKKEGEGGGEGGIIEPGLAKVTCLAWLDAVGQLTCYMVGLHIVIFVSSPSYPLRFQVIIDPLNRLHVSMEACTEVLLNVDLQNSKIVPSFR